MLWNINLIYDEFYHGSKVVCRYMAHISIIYLLILRWIINRSGLAQQCNRKWIDHLFYLFISQHSIIVYSSDIVSDIDMSQCCNVNISILPSHLFLNACMARTTTLPNFWTQCRITDEISSLKVPSQNM